ncbi:MAG: hypothetical protein Q9195_004638 [Heterodermia aff. obscurata]
MSPSPTTFFTPHHPLALPNLKNATLFTRINVRAAAPEAVKTALEHCRHTRSTFCLGHFNDILVFDTLETLHAAHVLVVLEMLRDNKWRSDIERCAFLQPTWAKAGFLMDRFCWMVILREHVPDEELGDWV